MKSGRFNYMWTFIITSISNILLARTVSRKSTRPYKLSTIQLLWHHKIQKMATPKKFGAKMTLSISFFCFSNLIIILKTINTLLHNQFSFSFIYFSWHRLIYKRNTEQFGCQSRWEFSLFFSLLFLWRYSLFHHSSNIWQFFS